MVAATTRTHNTLLQGLPIRGSIQMLIDYDFLAFACILLNTYIELVKFIYELYSIKKSRV